MNHWPLGFRPIFRSLAIADSWAWHRGGTSPRMVERWPEAFLTIAETCAAGKGVGEETWQTALGMMDPRPAQEQELVALILATPILLINANPYGHRRLAIQVWGEARGFSPDLLMALDAYFQRLGQRLGQDQAMMPSSWEHRPWDPSDQRLPNLADLWALATSLPGQGIAALTLAHQWGWPATALALVGVLAVVQSGPGGMPLQAMERFMVDRAMDGGGQALGSRWRGYGIPDLDALADALHQRWAGVPSAQG